MGCKQIFILRTFVIMLWRIIIIFCVLGIVLAGCAKPKTCRPGHFWKCIEREMSKNSCSQILSGDSFAMGESIGTSAGLTCLNKISGNLNIDQQEACKQKLRDDLQKNLGSRMKQIIDSVVQKCGI